jgi:hypothetical protein
LAGGRAGAVDPLSPWNDGATKKSITDFVATGQFSPSAIRTATSRLLEWTAAGDGARFTGLVDHTDAVPYDRQSHIGRLDKTLDEATTRGWTVVNMKNDWKVIFPVQKE